VSTTFGTMSDETQGKVISYEINYATNQFALEDENNDICFASLSNGLQTLTMSVFALNRLVLTQNDTITVDNITFTVTSSKTVAQNNEFVRKVITGVAIKGD